MADANIRLNAQGDLWDETEEFLEQEHPGDGRFNRLILIAFAAVAIVSDVVVVLGVESSGSGQSALRKPTDDPGASARNNGEIADLAAHGGRALAAPTFVPPPAVVWTRANAHSTNTTATAEPLSAMGGTEVH